MCAHYEPSCSTGKSLFIFYESMYKYRDSLNAYQCCASVAKENYILTFLSGPAVPFFFNTNFFEKCWKTIFNGPNVAIESMLGIRTDFWYGETVSSLHYGCYIAVVRGCCVAAL